MVVLHTSWFLHITVLFTFYGAFVVVYIGYCPDDESRNCNELIVMVTICLYSNTSVHQTSVCYNQCNTHKMVRA